jgi:hypothetical protein
VAFDAESLESRRLLSVANTNPFAPLSSTATPTTAAVASTPTVPTATSTGTGTSLGMAAFGNFGNMNGLGQAFGLASGMTGVVENIYIVNLEQGVGQFQAGYGLPELNLFIGIGSTGMSAPTTTTTLAPSASNQTPTITAAPQVLSNPTTSPAFSATPTTLASASTIAFLDAEFIVASLSAATQAALSGTGTSTTTTAQAHGAASTVGQATGSTSGSLVNTASPTNTIISSLSLLNSSSNSPVTTPASLVTALTSSLTSPFTPLPARPVQPVLNPPDTSKLRGNSAPENEGQPPVWRDLLNAPLDHWISMPPLHLSRMGSPFLEPGNAERVWDSAVSSLMADQVETMAASSPERLPALGEGAESVSPIESAVAVGLAVTAWVALERRTKGSDRLRQRQTPELTFDKLQ